MTTTTIYTAEPRDDVWMATMPRPGYVMASLEVPDASVWRRIQAHEVDLPEGWEVAEARDGLQQAYDDGGRIVVLTAERTRAGGVGIYASSSHGLRRLR